MDLLLGVDCGGTHLRAGLVTKDGELLADHKTKSPLKTNPNEFGQKVKEIYDQLVYRLPAFSEAHQLRFNQSQRRPTTDYRLFAIGVGVPGPIDSERGWILHSANLGNAEPIKFVDQLKTAFYRLPIFFDRDSEVALLGEVWQGGAKGLKNVCLLTLGTGVGGAIMADGKIIAGSHGLAGEIGHTYVPTTDYRLPTTDLPKCGLGHEGCLEALIKNSPLEDIPYILGTALAELVDLFNPEKILLGGGMMNQIRSIMPEIIEIMKDKSIGPASDQVLVEETHLKDLSGVIGAAYLAKQETLSPKF